MNEPNCGSHWFPARPYCPAKWTDDLGSKHECHLALNARRGLCLWLRHRLCRAPPGRRRREVKLGPLEITWRMKLSQRRYDGQSSGASS